MSFVDQNICVCGDFNVVQCGTERRSVWSSVGNVGSTTFSLFVDQNLLIDLPLRGRSFTWFHGHGKSMSCIDRFLLSDK